MTEQNKTCYFPMHLRTTYFLCHEENWFCDTCHIIPKCICIDLFVFDYSRYRKWRKNI